MTPLAVLVLKPFTEVACVEFSNTTCGNEHAAVFPAGFSSLTSHLLAVMMLMPDSAVCPAAFMPLLLHLVTQRRTLQASVA